jgi:hypothetical protein
MSNGIGTWFCTARYDAGWGWDDAVECAMFVFFPVWALRVVHVRTIPGGSFQSDSYEAIPLRWSDQLVRRVLLRRWFAGFVGLGLFILGMVALVTVWPPEGAAAREWAVTKPIFSVLAPCLVVAGFVGQWFLRPQILRERNIRRILGLHALGTSDPATWVDEDLAKMRDPKSLFGTDTFAQAVPKLLEAGAWNGALWAARLSAALEGESGALTDQVLRQPGVQEALAQFRRDPRSWPSAMGMQALAECRTRVLGTSEVRQPEVGPERNAL